MDCLRASLYTGHKGEEVKGKKKSSDLLRELTEVEESEEIRVAREERMIIML